MILIKLFFSLSCVSAAFVSTASRSLAAEFSRKRGQNSAELAEIRIPMSLPKMPSFPNLLPIAHCDSLPENPGPNTFFSTIRNALFNEDRTLKWNQDFEKMLEKEDYVGLSEAYKKGEIDYSYMPRTHDFYRILLHYKCTEGDKILKRFFNSGVIDDMVDKGLLKYQDIVNAAIKINNENIANLALDRLIAIHRPDLKSFKYKSKPRTVQKWIYASKRDQISVITIDCSNYDHFLYPEHYKFAKNYFLIFEKEPMEPWMADLNKNTFCIEFNECNF